MDGQEQRKINLGLSVNLGDEIFTGVAWTSRFEMSLHTFGVTRLLQIGFVSGGNHSMDS